MTRSNILEVMREDYIRTARAKGLWNLRFMNPHAKNAMLPVVTMMALQISSSHFRVRLLQRIFSSIPGIGRLAVNAIETRDMPLYRNGYIYHNTGLYWKFDSGFIVLYSRSEN